MYLSEVFYLSSHFVLRHGRDLFFIYPSGDGSDIYYRVWREGSLLPEAKFNDGVRLPSADDSLSISHEGSRLFKLVADPSGGWQSPKAIDHFKALPYAPFEAQSTGPGHLVLFYQTQAEECQVGYREITPSRTGPFHRFLNERGSLEDASFLTTMDELHLLFIFKTALSQQLLYRKKTEEVFTPPILLWEAPRMEQCLLMIIGGELHASCMIGGKLHRAVSVDGGDSFGAFALYKRKFCAEPVKAAYMGAAEGWFARHVYVDREAPWDVQILPELHPAFYPAKHERQETAEVRDLTERLAAAQLAMAAKDRQIMELIYAGNIAKSSQK